MIDVLKRLAELDAKNPNVVKEGSNLEECGMMPMPGMAELESAEAEKPAHPATLNITAGSGEELSNMLTAIMQLAGVKKVGADDLGQEHDPMTLTAEPSLSATPDMGAGDDMRSMMSVVDKLNPELDEPHGGANDGMSADQGDIDNDGDHDMDDHEAEKEKEKEDEGMYDNSSSNPNDKPAFDSNKFANQENKPGQGDRMDGNMPTANVKRMEESLFAEYKAFIGEAKDKEDDSDMEEGIEDRIKDLDPKNPVNVPAYQRKAASGDSAQAAKNTKESANESMSDILKLSGLLR